MFINSQTVVINTHALLLDISYHIGTDVWSAQMQILKLEQGLVNSKKVKWLVLRYFLVQDIKNKD